MLHSYNFKVLFNEGTVRAGDYVFSMEKETKIINGEQDFLYITK